MADNGSGAGKRGSFPDIFVSHSSIDQVKVKEVVHGLNQAGLTTYCSSVNLMSSVDDWEIKVHELLMSCPIVLGVISRNALKSVEEVLPEWRIAKKKRKLLFVRLEEFPVDDLMYRYQGLHYEDLSQWKGAFNDEAWNKLIESLKLQLQWQKEANAASSTAEAGEAGGSETPTGKGGPSAGANSDDRRFPVIQHDFGTIGAAALPQAALPSEQPAIAQEALPEDSLPPLEAALGLGLDARDWSIANGTDLVRKALGAHAFVEIHRAARAGQIDAQGIVALVYQAGTHDIPADYGAAGRWLEKAAAGGCARAKAELAVLLASRCFGSFDLERIDALTAEAAADGCVRARTFRALLRLTGTRLPSLPYDQISRLLEQAHEDGDLLATTQLGWGLLQGLGMRRDSQRGFELLQQASQAGDPRAMAYLGIAYAWGRGVGRDPYKAAHWFARSALRNDPLGQFYLAWCHETGVGVARDASEARKLYAVAAGQGDANARIRLARMLIDGRGGVADLARAAQLLGTATNDEEVEAEAMAMLAELLEEGRGMPRDLARAVSLYEKAAEEDHPRALWNLGRLYEEGRGVGQDREHAIRLFRRAALNATTKSFFLTVLTRLDLLGAPLRRAKQ